MRIIQLSKQEDGKIIHAFRTIDRDGFPVDLLKRGNIILLGRSSFLLLKELEQKTEIMNCGAKQPHIELFRALKYQGKGHSAIPRKLIINSKNPGGFKRSLFSLLEKRLSHDHPPAILVIHDEILDELAESFYWSEKNNNTHPLAQMVSAKVDTDILYRISKVFIGISPEAELTRIMIYLASQTTSNVLILGESGTGKDVIANQIYNFSKRYKKDKLYKINCSTLQDNLLESELFGHKKGSFTDAVSDKQGIFEAAHGGTLFLDEVGELSPANQAKVLQAVENKEIRPLGSTKTIKVDVRIIAATNRNLPRMIQQDIFRDDLYYRLNAFTIISPPLRERPVDIPVIAQALWNRFGCKETLSHAFLNYLKGYTWPGNVRELKILLNNIIDIFGKISPKPEHIEMIREYRRDILVQAQQAEIGDFDKLLKAQCKNRLITAGNIMRRIKIMFRPIISEKIRKPGFLDEMDELRTNISKEISKLEDICREPLYFKDRNLFERIKRFRYILEILVKNWPASPDEIRNQWQSNMETLYDEIEKGIFRLVWETMEGGPKTD